MNNLLKMTEADYNTMMSAAEEPKSPYVINIYDTGKVKYSSDPSTEYFTIIPLSTSETFEISIENMNHRSFSNLTTTNYLFYSLNGGDSWQRVTEASDNIISITFNTTQYVGKKIIFKSNLWANHARILINCSQNHYVSGNVLSLSQGDLFTEYPTDIYNESFNGLFMENTHLISAKNLYLPERYEPAHHEYYSTIFYACTNLHSTSIIKITGFTSYNTFWCGLSGCTNLTNVYISITGELLQYAAENNITSTMGDNHKMFCNLLQNKSTININLITDITLDINDATYRNLYRYGLRELVGYFYGVLADMITADHQLATNWTINNIPLKDILDLNDINEHYGEDDTQ